MAGDAAGARHARSGETGFPRPSARASSPADPVAIHLPRRPLLHGGTSASRLLLSTTPIPEASAAPPGLSNLKLPGKRRRAAGSGAPSRSPLALAGRRISAASRPRGINTRDLTLEPAAPAPPPDPRFWALGCVPSSEAAVPAVCNTDPHPGIEGQERTFPGPGFSSCLAARPKGWARVATAPPAGRKTLRGRSTPGWVSLLYLQPLHHFGFSSSRMSVRNRLI